MTSLECMSCLVVFAMKCCTKMPCPLPHNHYCCLFPSPICLSHLLICTCLISSPIACPSSSVLCWCLLRFYSCYMLHFFVTPFWLVCVHIFSLLFSLYCLVEHDICNSSVPCMDDGCHGFMAGKQLAASCLH